MTQSTFWDFLVFRKIRSRVGGRVKLLATGAAPIDPAMIQFFRAVLGCEVLEGYGQTESCAAGTCSRFGDYLSPFGAHVGAPYSGIEIKLVDVPAMEYLATDKPHPRGEICIRGAVVMKGTSCSAF